MIKKYMLRKQLNNRGCYAEIFFSYKRLDLPNRQLIISYNADSRWENSCKVGIEIFYEYFSQKEVDSLEVHIQEIKWMPADTNNLIILFSTIQALSEGLDFPIGNLALDTEEEWFIFPEKRSLW